MSIVINNISEGKGVPYLSHGECGIQHYQVCLNVIPLVEFTHNSEGGMPACISKAALALEGIDVDAKVEEHKKQLSADLLKYAEQHGIG